MKPIRRMLTLLYMNQVNQEIQQVINQTGKQEVNNLKLNGGYK